MTIGATLLRVIPLTAATLAVVEIILINSLAGSGRIIQYVDQSIDQLREQNSVLEQRVASASSLMTIAAKSQEMGFVSPLKSQVVTISSDQLPVAYQGEQ